MFSILRIVCLLAFLLTVNQSGFCSQSDSDEKSLRKTQFRANRFDDHSDQGKTSNTPANTKVSGLANLVAVRVADGFDHPLGKPEGAGYIMSEPFSPTHAGEDWRNEGAANGGLGDPVYSIGNGYVTFAKDVGAEWGNVVIVRHAFVEGDKLKTVDSMYAHLDQIMVDKGHGVSRGQKIATIGTNHGMYSPHLHFEIRKNLSIGIKQSDFAKDLTNYYRPMQFIALRRRLAGTEQIAQIVVKPYSTDTSVIHPEDYHVGQNQTADSKFRENAPPDSDFEKNMMSRREKEIAEVEPPLKSKANPAPNSKISSAKPAHKKPSSSTAKNQSKEADDLNQKGIIAYQQGDYAKAQELFELALAIREKVLGPQHQDTVNSIDNIAVIYCSIGDYDKARELQEHTLVIREKVLGSQHPDTAASLSNLANTYNEMGDYAKAKELQERALAIMEKVIGPQHPNMAHSLNSLASSYANMGDYAKAQELFERALAIREKVLGPQHPDTVASLGNLGATYFRMEDYPKARELQERALAIMEKVIGPQHPYMASLLGNLAATYNEMGNYAKAKELEERALAIQEKVLGSQHPDTATSLSNLGITFIKLGDFVKARELQERALAIRVKVLGSQHPETGDLLSNLAITYDKLGDHAKARELQEHTLAIREKVLGPQHPETVASLGNLGATYFRMEDYPKARELQERALAIHEKVLGSQHPDTAASLNNLAITYSSLGDYAKARELQERALAIHEKVLGPQHPETAVSLGNLATTYSAIGDLGSARSSASRAAAGIDRQLQSVLSMDEKSRLSWQKENLSMDVFASVLRPEQIAQLSLRWKGVVLASLMEDRALTMAFSKNKNSSKELQELQGLRTQLAKIAFDQNKKEEADKISEKIGAIQRSMASRSTGFGRVRASADLTVDTILPALSGGSVFVDLFEFNDHKLKGDERLHYGAILIAEDGTPAFIRIPDRVAIDRAADAIRTAVKNGDEQSLQENLATLSTKLWKPVAEKIPAETKRIIVSPDGKLSFISFASLLDGEGKFICEKYLISYVASGRDLAKQDAAKENKTITLFANPKFDLNSTKKIGDRLAMRSSEISAFGNIQLPPLLGTEDECNALKQAAISTGWNPTTYVGAEATEQQIRSVKNTGILHLATHGFYLNAFTPAKDDTRGMSVIDAGDTPKPQAQNGADPMRASGIALSGAQNTIKEWSKGKCPDPENDGILTAEEVAGLNLDGTWIVTLSACETGIGEARSGEGVFGLRRAFMMAGSKNLIMTLWAVNDASTAEIMADFYKRCFASSDASRSLAETQRDWLLKIKKDKGLLAAVRDAGPFVIATTGKP